MKPNVGLFGACAQRDLTSFWNYLDFEEKRVARKEFKVNSEVAYLQVDDCRVGHYSDLHSNRKIGCGVGICGYQQHLHNISLLFP